MMPTRMTVFVCLCLSVFFSQSFSLPQDGDGKLYMGVREAAVATISGGLAWVPRWVTHHRIPLSSVVELSASESSHEDLTPPDDADDKLGARNCDLFLRAWGLALGAMPSMSHDA